MKANYKNINRKIITIIGLISLICSTTHAISRLSEAQLTITYPEELSPNLFQSATQNQVIVGHTNQPINLIVTAYEIDSLGANEDTATQNELAIQKETIQTSNKPLQIVGKLLNFPNPFSLKDGGTTIRYQLNKDAPIELRIYDPFANEILRDSFSFGQNGGAANTNDYVNNVLVKKETFNTNNIPAGIYFYAILSEGSVLGRGKMAIIP